MEQQQSRNAWRQKQQERDRSSPQCMSEIKLRTIAQIAKLSRELEKAEGFKVTSTRFRPPVAETKQRSSKNATGARPADERKSACAPSRRSL
jgi:hypothetical protein